MTELESYNELKIQYEAMQIKIEKLDKSWVKYYDIWVSSNYGNKERKLLQRKEREQIQTRKLAKSVSHKLLVMDYQETGITVSKLSRKYNVGPNTIKKLFKENNVEYRPAQMLRWRPIGSAPKDGTEVVLCGIVGIYKPSDPIDEKYDFAIAGWNQNNWIIHSNEDVIFYNPTHWMPIPEPPHD